MRDHPNLRYGGEPGLRFACLLDGKGGCRDLDWAGVDAWKPGDGVLWIHLERDDPAAQAWVRERSGLDRFAAEALLDEDTRPRIEDWDDALLVVLRGVNRGQGASADPEDLELVPLHLWADANRIISLRDKSNLLLALRVIREKLVLGKGPSRAGAVFMRIAERLVKHLEPVIDEFEDTADTLEETLLDEATPECRRQLSELRRRAINLRRYLSPQREALYRLQAEDATWITKTDRTRLREVTDRLMRHVETLDALRDRTMLLHEDLAAQIAEEHARSSNRLTLVAALLLPPSLVAGLLGANVGGIPGNENPWAFAAVVAVVLLLFPFEILFLRWLKWF